MTSNPRSERLSLLRAKANRSLDTFLRRTVLSTPASGNSRDEPSHAKRYGADPPPTHSVSLAFDSPKPTADPDKAGSVSNDTTVNVNLMGGTIFLDDERSIRALAKETKRLITEDRRRGLGVGG